VLILLPPSEAKSTPHAGPKLDLDGLSFPELRTTRRKAVSALVNVCRSDPAAAAQLLGLGPRQADEIARNARLRRAACAPAIEVYTGVLFDAFGYGSQSTRHRERTSRSVVIASALWGLVRPDDRIPAYRLSGASSLPVLGTMRSVWHTPLVSALNGMEGLVLDLRSGAYRELSRTPARDAWVFLRVFQEREGRRTVVSHSNKATKGLIARAAVTSSREPTSIGTLQSALGAWGYRVERERDAAATLDVILD
jgi:cytoplasmic iron level regulating protein YaaA (DUF328/UPF0246 family)